MKTNSHTKDNLAIYLFHQGTNFNAFQYFGVHFKENCNGAYFRTWAPNAKCVSVVGDFNGFSEDGAVRMQKLSEGVWEAYIENVKQFDAYKFLIETHDGRRFLKADPFAFHSETNGRTASKVYDIDREFAWTDQKWFEYNKQDFFSAPINIYEVHFGSFLRRKNGNYLTYREMADELVPYVLEMGYTHIELMPLTEYPFDGSWGYQVTGFFSLTSRFGTPEDFAYFVNKFHEYGVGIIMDWVPAHFAKDQFGLMEFDGQPLYESQGWDRMENKGWGTRMFDFGRPEVQSFLVSSAVFWLKKFHIDGLRVDAIASMIYLDYDKQPHEWIPNVYGENKNLEAIALLKKLNKEIRTSFPDKIMIAEESTAFADVTKSVEKGGLGFHFKWNMGWMHDVLDYMSTNSFFRKHHQNKLTFSFMYSFSEHFILPISHDEVVHGKKSLLDKMSGQYDEKFGNFRTFLSYMIAHPGKKLMFMGSEFGQFREWNYAEGLEWFMLKYETHKKLHRFVKAINHLYLRTKEFYEIDGSSDGVYFNCADSADENVLAFSRKCKKGSEIFCVFNFSPVKRENFKIGAGFGEYQLIFNSDCIQYGGTGEEIAKTVHSQPVSQNGFNDSISLTLPPLSAQFYKKIII